MSNGISSLETLSEEIARGFAQRVSRRSFLGRLGKGMIAASLGAGGAAILAEDAFAHACNCERCDCSIGCAALPGHNSNSCPPGTCTCGCWCVSGESCPAFREWCDCCGGDYCNPHGCRCVTGTDGCTRPSCCHHKEWPGGCGSSSWHIACRRSQCVSAGQCEDFTNGCGSGC